MGEIVVGVFEGEERIREIWVSAEPYIRRALDRAHGELTSKDVFERLLQGYMSLWGVYNWRRGQYLAFLVTEVVEYPRKRALRVTTLAGVKMSEWKETVAERLNEFCRELDLDGIEAVGRRGFVKALEGVGFKEQYTVVYREVT